MSSVDLGRFILAHCDSAFVNHAVHIQKQLFRDTDKKKDRRNGGGGGERERERESKDEKNQRDNKQNVHLCVRRLKSCLVYNISMLD